MADVNNKVEKTEEQTEVSKTIFVEEPKRPQTNEASAIKDYFYFASTNGLVLYPGSEHPITLNQLDFCFGEDTTLEYFFLEGGKQPLAEDEFKIELNQPNGRLLTWDGEKGEELVKTYLDLLKNAKKGLYISCHGDSYDDGGGSKIWGLYALDTAYGADRVINAAIKEGYDLIVMTSCNPDGLPLEIESKTDKRPTIMRFNTDNSYYIPADKDPIVIIPAIID